MEEIVGFYRKSNEWQKNRVILIFQEWKEFLLLCFKCYIVLGKILQHLDVLDFETSQRSYIPWFTGYILGGAYSQFLSSFFVFEIYVWLRERRYPNLYPLPLMLCVGRDPALAFGDQQVWKVRSFWFKFTLFFEVSLVLAANWLSLLLLPDVNLTAGLATP